MRFKTHGANPGIYSRSPLHYIFRRCSRPRQIVWCYTNHRYKPYLSHRKVRLLTALLNCQNCQFWQFDRDKRTVGLVFIIYRVLLVYIRIGLAWWMCRHTFKLVRGRRRLKRSGGSQLPVRKFCSTKISRSMCTHILNLVCDCILGHEVIKDIGTLSFRWVGSLYIAF